MGRIVIPRPQQRRREQIRLLPKQQKYGYFSRGFGPQEMQLINRLVDLAVAGGGQIARAVQIGNREREQEEAQADYDRRLQSEIESRQRAAQAEIDDASVSGQVEAFFAQQEPPSVRERLPSLSSMSLQSGLVQPRPMQRGGVSPGVLARPGVLAPEDLSMARAQMAARLQPDTMVSAMQRPDVAAVFDLGDAAGFKAVEDAMRRGVIDPAGMPRTSVDEAEGIMNAASMRAYSDALQRLEQLDRQGVQESVRAARSLPPSRQITGAEAARALLDERGNPSNLARNLGLSEQGVQELIGSTGFEVPDAEGRMAALGEDPALRYRPQVFGAADPAIAERLRQAMQGRDFRQEAMEAIGPAPERKLFRIADILAAAPSARTAEQRAMLLQAAVDSPDIQAANLSDLAKGAYRDRAMQAVMKLFPEEEEPVSELDMLRMQSMRERMETENLRQQKLQAELDKSAAKAARRANALKSVRPKDSKKEEMYNFYVSHWAKHDRGEMGDEEWAQGAGELANVDPGGLRRWAETNKLSRATRKAATQDANTIMRMRAPRPPAPKPPKVVTPPVASGLRKDLIKARGEFRDLVDEINKPDISDKKRESLSLDLVRVNRRRRDIEEQLGLISAIPVSTQAPAPSGAVYNAATGQYE